MLIPSVSKRNSSRSITLINQFNCKQIFSWHNKEINAIGFVCGKKETVNIRLIIRIVNSV